jgi:hypothetical protein
MIMEYTHDKYCDMPLTLGVSCNSRAGTAAREYTLVDGIQTLMCFDDWSGVVSVRQEV